MYYNLYEIRLKEFWNIKTVTIYRTAENFTKLAEKLKDIEEAFNLEINSVREIEDFDQSNKKNLYKIHITQDESCDFDTFITAEDYAEAGKWAKELWEREDTKIEYIQELANFKPYN